MTLEEAKKEIKRLADCQLSKFDKNPNQQAWRKARAYENAYDILDEIDTEPVGNPDTLTLRELAHELRRIFRFKYLTAHRSGVELFLRMYAKEPSYFKTYGVWSNAYVVFFPIAVSVDLRVDLDLSDYADENGEIDYSKCLVEVEE